MNPWILIVFTAVTSFSIEDRNHTLTFIPGFISEAKCQDVGNKIKAWENNYPPRIEFICVDPAAELPSLVEPYVNPYYKGKK